jgi:hypothetical protein
MVKNLQKSLFANATEDKQSTPGCLDLSSLPRFDFYLLSRAFSGFFDGCRAGKHWGFQKHHEHHFLFHFLSLIPDFPSAFFLSDVICSGKNPSLIRNFSLFQDFWMAGFESDSEHKPLYHNGIVFRVLGNLSFGKRVC